MVYTTVLWDSEDDPDGNVQHIAQHEISKAEVEQVFEAPMGRATSRSSGRPIVFAEVRSGRIIAVVYEAIDRDTVYPITAFEVEP